MSDLYLFNKKGILTAQLLNYGFVGVVSNLSGYIIYLLITYLGGEPKMTMSVLYGVGVVISFLGNRKLTFKHTGYLPGAIYRYFVAYGIGYIINLAILIVMVDSLGYTHQFVQLGAMAVLVFYFFVTLKYYVFKH